MSRRLLLPAILALAVLPVCAQTSTGTLLDFHMTATASMQGMPAMPARSIERKVCMAPGKFDPQALLHQGAWAVETRTAAASPSWASSASLFGP